MAQKSNKKKKNYTVNDILTHQDTNGNFERDKNDTSKVWCSCCRKSYAPDLNTLKNHLSKPKHMENKRKKNLESLESLMKFPDFSTVSRASIIWTYLVIMRNLSFNFNDYAGDYLPHIFADSKTALRMKIYRQKILKILSQVLELHVQNSCQKYMKKICTLMIDGSRDIGNRNELMIGATFYDSNKNEIKRVIFEIIEQNETKSQKLYDSITKLLNENHIPYAAILAVMTDNANEMCGNEGGLTTLMKSQNKSIYSTTCICHSLNIILKNLMKWINQENHDIDSQIIEVEYFLNSITSMFNYSYKKEEQFRNFKEDFLKKKHNEDENLYPKIEKFCKISTYSDVRFLSLGNSMKNILPQWICLKEFFKSQIKDKKESSLSPKQVEDLKELIAQLNNNDFRFFFLLLKFIVDELNYLNRIFQRHKNQLHLAFPLSRKLLKKLIKIMYVNVSDSLFEDPKQLKKEIQNIDNFVDYDDLLTNLKGFIDFDQEHIEFEVKIDELHPKTIKFHKSLFPRFVFFF